MVNKIKFWDNENDKWVGEDTDYYLDEKGKVFHIDDSIPDDYSIIQDEHIRPVYFTGFFDIYNEPIYSNSLVKIVNSKDKDFPGFKDYLRSIRFKNGSYVVDISSDELDLVKKFGHREIEWFDLEIVGNSFVNKPTVREVSLDIDKLKSLQYAIELTKLSSDKDLVEDKDPKEEPKNRTV